MNFFGGSNCNEEFDKGHGERDNCCSLIFILLLLSNCGGCNMKGINIDSGTILLLLLLSNCGHILGCRK